MKKTMSLLLALVSVSLALPLSSFANTEDTVMSCDSTSFKGYPEVQVTMNRDMSAAILIGKSTNKPVELLFSKVGVEQESYVGSEDGAQFKMTVKEDLGSTPDSNRYRMVLTVASNKIAGTYVNTPVICDIKRD